MVLPYAIMDWLFLLICSEQFKMGRKNNKCALHPGIYGGFKIL